MPLFQKREIRGPLMSLQTPLQKIKSVKKYIYIYFTPTYIQSTKNRRMEIPIHIADQMAVRCKWIGGPTAHGGEQAVSVLHKRISYPSAQQRSTNRFPAEQTCGRALRLASESPLPLKPDPH